MCFPTTTVRELLWILVVTNQLNNNSFVIISKIMTLRLSRSSIRIATFDHVLGNEFVKQHFQAPLAIPKGEKEIFLAVQSYAPVYGFHQYKQAEIDQYIDESDSITFGDITLKVLLVPGHSPGHLAFYHPESGSCLSGDVLFLGSIGRTDLPGGDHQTLIESIHQKMFSLPEETTVYSGHGPPTTIGQEKKSNPFCAVV